MKILQTIYEFDTTEPESKNGLYHVELDSGRKVYLLRNHESVGAITHYLGRSASECVSIIRDDVKQEFFKLLKADMESQQKEADRPKVVCLCGSTRFGEAFQKAQFDLTMQGVIVLTIGCNMKSDKELFGSYSEQELTDTKTKLDELHKRKIDLADEVFILNVGNYIGESTQNELSYAYAHGKLVNFLQPSDALLFNWNTKENYKKLKARQEK